MSSISKAVRLLRIFHDTSQTQLAKDLGISNSFLSEIESGAKAPTLQLLEKYSKRFDIPISSLLFFSESLKSGKESSKMRGKVSAKILKLLEWLATKG